MISLILAIFISADGAMHIIDKSFGPTDPEAYELDYFEKCDLIQNKSITVDAACIVIKKEYQ